MLLVDERRCAVRPRRGARAPRRGRGDRAGRVPRTVGRRARRRRERAARDRTTRRGHAPGTAHRRAGATQLVVCAAGARCDRRRRNRTSASWSPKCARCWRLPTRSTFAKRWPGRSRRRRRRSNASRSTRRCSPAKVRSRGDASPSLAAFTLDPSTSAPSRRRRSTALRSPRSSLFCATPRVKATRTRARRCARNSRRSIPTTRGHCLRRPVTRPTCST